MQAIPARPSLVAHYADFLRDMLRSGEWTEFLPSERTLCSQLRISRPTLRAVLVQLEREGVVGAVENKKRSIPSAQTAKPAAARSRVIALLTPIPAQLMPPFVLFWVDALRELLAGSGYQLELRPNARCYTPKPAAGLKMLTRHTHAAAWVLFRSTPAMQRWFFEQRIPAVIAGSCSDGVELPSADIDYRATCRHAVTMLQRKGHQRIALLLPDLLHGGDIESERGYREAIAAARGKPCVIQHHGAPEQVAAHLDAALRGRQAPTALIVGRSVHVLTVVTHLLRMRFRLPDEVAVVSRDDDAFLDHVLPRITRYAADPAKFARRLSHLVLEMAQTGRASKNPVRLMPDLKKGQTA